MKSINKGLYLYVPTPCGENWLKMTRTATGKHCGSCNKTVIDFSLLTDNEIFTVINNSKGNLCGRFSDDQLGRNICASIPQRSSFVPAMLITAGLAVGIASEGYAGTRGLERVAMAIVPPVADTSQVAKTHTLPEIVVVGYEVKRGSFVTGAVSVNIESINAKRDKPLVAKSLPVLYEPVKKKKKRFLFF